MEANNKHSYFYVFKRDGYNLLLKASKNMLNINIYVYVYCKTYIIYRQNCSYKQ